MFSDVAQKIEDADGPPPVGVVEQKRGIRRAFEIEQAAELSLEAGNVGFEDFGREEIAFRRFAARVADHAGRAPRHGDGAMSRHLEPAQDEQADQVAEVEAVGGRIETGVNGDRRRVGREEPFEFLAVGHVGDESAPLKVL